MVDVAVCDTTAPPTACQKSFTWAFFAVGRYDAVSDW